MQRAVSRKDFLGLGGAVLAVALLLGSAGCGGGLRGNKKVVKFFTGTEETTALEREAIEIQVNRFEEQHPDIDLQRAALQPDEARRETKSRVRSKEPSDVFSYDTGSGFGGVLADAGLLYPWRKPTNKRVGTTTSGPSSGPPTAAPSTGSPIRPRR